MRSVTVLSLIIYFIIAVSCSNERPEIVQRGYINFSMLVENDDKEWGNITSRVPDCIGQPEYVKIRLLNDWNLAHTDTSRIEINNNMITNIDTLQYPIGDYMIDEISLLNSNYTITHTVPHVLRDDQLWAALVQPILPFGIIIDVESHTDIQAEAVCYTTPPNDIELENEAEITIAVQEYETLLFYIPPNHCLDSVSVQLNLDTPVWYTSLSEGINEAIIKADSAFYRVNGYNDGLLMQSFVGDHYNADELLNSDDILIFDTGCR